MPEKFQLKDYQKKAVEAALAHREGILLLGTGLGKSLCALEIIHRLRLTAVILVDRQALMYQMGEEAKLFYGFQPAYIGDGKEEYNPRLTIALFQSLASKKELLKELASKTSVVIADEIQGIVTKQRIRVLESFRPAYLYGMTATLARSDEQEKAISFYCGEVFFEYSQTVYTPIVEMIETFSRIPVGEYVEMVDMLIRDNARNTLIAEYAKKEIQEGRKLLILTKRRDHAHSLYEYLKDIPGVFHISSSDKSRFDLLSDFKKNNLSFSVIVGTTSLLSAGIDVPITDSIFFACDMKAEVLLAQSAGRILRFFEGKPTPRITDFCDGSNIIFRRQAQARRRVYEKRGWQIER